MCETRTLHSYNFCNYWIIQIIVILQQNNIQTIVHAFFENFTINVQLNFSFKTEDINKHLTEMDFDE